MNSLIARIKKLYKLLPPLFSRDMKERYAGSSLGVVWTILNPVLIILLYWMVFSSFLNIKIPADRYEVPFFIYLLTGILPWFMFQDGALRGATSIIDKGHIIKKVFFPPELFPLSVVLVSFISYVPGVILIVIGVGVWKGIVFSHLVLFIFMLFLHLIFTVGVALLLSSITVYVRDIVHILSFVFQILFYTTTVLYPLALVPEKYRDFLLLNPITGFIESYHDLILFSKMPSSFSLLYPAVSSVVFFVVGVKAFRKLKTGFVDVL
ncbi:MAG TPA: ABC transporter permease [Thermodesulfovibrionales bacterium]|nr:ABC transporter permease [Thermodesulfovibrionales bacterium]